MKMGRIKPYKNGPSVIAEEYIKLSGDEVEHPIIQEMFSCYDRDVCIFGKAENTDFYLIRDGKHTTKPEYSLLICVKELRTILGRQDLIYLQFFMERLSHLSRDLSGGVEIYYYNIDRTVFMLNVENVDDGFLFEEFIRKGKFMWKTPSEQDENTDNGKQDN